MDPTHAPLLQAPPPLPPTYPLPFLPPSSSLPLGLLPQGQGEGRRKGGGRGEEGEGGPGFHLAPPFLRPALPHL
jgi:hypothetical protein